jgi:hypothetical protein
LGTGCPFSVTVAVMTEVELTNGLAFDTTRVMLAPVGGVVGDDGVVGVDGVVVGEVGDSPLQAANISSSAKTANKNFRCRMLIISTPVIPSSHPWPRLYAHPLHA